MSSVSELVSIFSAGGTPVTTTENIQLFKTEYQALDCIMPQTGLEQILTQFQATDLLVLSIAVDNNVPSTLTWPGGVPDVFLNAVEKALGFRDPGDVIKIKVEIDKRIAGDNIRIYDSVAFYSYLLALNIDQKLELFERLLSDRKRILFTDDTKTSYASASIGSWSALVGIDAEQRLTKNTQLRTVCNYGHSGSRHLLPEDFRLITRSSDENINAFFDRLCLLHCIICILDITDVTPGGQLDYRLNGYRVYTGSIAVDALDISSLESYYQVYNWIYSGGNLSDKVGLARNLLSLHLADPATLRIRDDLAASLRSAYDVYLKQNIKQYIEIRNKLSDQLADFNKRATQIVDSFAGGFQKGALAVLTFFSTVLVARLLTKGDLHEIFDYDAYVLSLVFIFGSSVYLFVSLRDVDRQLERFRNNYRDMRLRYTDLLNETDINLMLNQDREFHADEDYMIERRRHYRDFWVGLLVLIFVTTTILHIFYLIRH